MILETDLIRAALQVKADASEPREFLRCIHINEKHIEATDGKALVRMEHGQAVNVDILVNFTQEIPAEAEFSQFVLTEKPFVIHYNDAEEVIAYSYIELINSKYPQFDNVIPDSVTDKMPLIQSKLLALPYLLFECGAIGIQVSSKNSAVQFIFDALTNYRYGNPLLIVMPTYSDYFTEVQKILDNCLSEVE